MVIFWRVIGYKSGVRSRDRVKDDSFINKEIAIEVFSIEGWRGQGTENWKREVEIPQWFWDELIECQISTLIKG